MLWIRVCLMNVYIQGNLAQNLMHLLCSPHNTAAACALEGMEITVLSFKSQVG